MKPGDSVPFVQRFYSTLPDTFENSFRMNVGQMPQDAIIADRYCKLQCYMHDEYVQTAL